MKAKSSKGQRSHLKMDGWNTIVSFYGFGLFSGANLLLVSGRSEGDFVVFPRKKSHVPRWVPFSSTRNHEADIAGQLHLAGLVGRGVEVGAAPLKISWTVGNNRPLKKNTYFFGGETWRYWFGWKNNYTVQWKVTLNLKEIRKLRRSWFSGKLSYTIERKLNLGDIPFFH